MEISGPGSLYNDVNSRKSWLSSVLRGLEDTNFVLSKKIHKKREKGFDSQRSIPYKPLHRERTCRWRRGLVSLANWREALEVLGSEARMLSTQVVSDIDLVHV